jgi:POTRA domain-containing FtsQ-type protein
VSRLFGRQNRRRGSRGETPVSARSLARAATAGGLAVAALVAWPFLRDAVRHHPYFAVREVLVGGQARLAPDAIRRLAGLEPGLSIWDVDCAVAERRLRAEPWIRSAAVRRQLPHRVAIQVREERPVAILVTEGPQPALYYVAAHGRIFAPLGPADARDFPYLSGLGAGDLDGGSAFGPRTVRHALTLLRVAARVGGPVAHVSEVHVDRARGLTLLPVRPTVPIEVGWSRFETKLAHLPTVLALWSGREAEIAAVSLIFDDEVIVRTQGPPGAPARRPAGA